MPSRFAQPDYERPLPDLPRAEALRLRARLAAALRGEAPFEAFLAEDGDAALHAARAHGVAALLGRELPALTADVQAVRFAAMRGGAFTVRVARAVEAAGVPCVVLKGLAVAALAWDDPSLRAQSDVDLLVPGERMADAERALVEAGLARPRAHENPFAHHDHLAPATAGGLLVELHRTLALDGPFGRDLGEVFDRRIRVETPDGAVPTLSDEDAVIQLALHASGHGTERLAWLVDLDGYARRRPVDWAAAARRARRWGVAPTVWLVWDAARRTVGAPIPEAGLGALRVPRWQRRAARALLEASLGTTGRRGWALGRAHRLATTPGPRALVKLVALKARMYRGMRG